MKTQLRLLGGVVVAKRKEQNKKTDYIDNENHGMAAKLIVDSFLREKR